jgi:ATP-binding cassette subfamily C protein
MIETLRKCVQMLPPGTRRRWLLLIPIAILTGAAEAGAAAGVFAFVTLLTNPAGALSIGWVAALVRYLPRRDPNGVIVEVALLMCGYLVFKGALVIAAQYLRVRVSHSAAADLACTMLRRYLSAPYPFHFKRNSSELIRNCTVSIGEVLGGVLGASVSLCTDLLMASGIALVLTATSPWLSIVTGIAVAAITWIVLAMTRRAASRHGEDTYELSVSILRSLQHALGGIKEVKVLGRERYFYDDFADRQRALLTLGYLGVTLNSVPMIVIQTFLFCGGLILVAALTVSGIGGVQSLPIAGVFGYAGIRVFSMANGVFVTIMGIRSSQRAVDRLHDDYRALSAAEAEASRDGHIEFRSAIELDAVSYTYPEGEKPAVEDVSITIRRGESIGIVGPTGAGKSTLVDLILGLLPPTSGTISVDGKNLTGVSTPWKRRVGYVPQSVFLTDDTLRRNIALGISDAAIDDNRIREVLAIAQLHRFVAELPQGLETRVGERGIRLSGGERQRVAIARALYHDPDLIVFDEATSSLDVTTEAEVNRTIDALRGVKTMVVIAHRLSSVKACDRLVWLRRGRIAGLGSFDELRASSSEFRAMTHLAAV